MATMDLIFAIAAGMDLLMIVLQAVLNRRVWDGYLWALPVILVVWVLVSPWPLSVVS